MKDNLDDLLRQFYAQKEEPSQEFCQSVIRQIKEKDQKAFFGTRKRGYYQGVLMAAICAGIIILAGMGMQIYRHRLDLNGETSGKQSIAEYENQTSVETKSPMETDHSFDEKNKVETDHSFDEKDKVETDPATDDEQLHQKGSDHGEDGFSNRTTGVPGGLPGTERNALSKSGGQSRTKVEGSDTETVRTSKSVLPSGTRKPRSTVPPSKTGRPQDTTAPSKTKQPQHPVTPTPPSRTMPPQNTTEPQENYVVLCSIETDIFSANPEILAPGEVEPPSSDSIFDSQLIVSYEQLQMLTEELEEKLAQNSDSGLLNILQRLKEYDPSYFVSSALCVNLSFLRAGMDVTLHTVRICDMGQGKQYLDIRLEAACDETEESSGKQYYSSFVSVPQTVARQCSMVQFVFD